MTSARTATTNRDANAVLIQAQLRFGSAFALEADVRLPGQGVSAIFGPSGCGKTTLLRVAAGLTRPDRGRVVVNGDVWQDDASDTWLPTHRRPLGMVFQEASLFPHLSVQGNLDFGLKRVPAAQRRVPLAQAIELLGIGHLLQRRPAYLSGGERQRVAIARALATSPRLLLMDEPLASLDAPRKAELLPWLERLVRELSIPVLYVTHAVDEVTRLADHLLLLENGQVNAAGAAIDLLSRLDIASAQGEHASVIVDGEVIAFHASDQLLELRFAGGVLRCAHAPESPVRRVGQQLRARVLARDVSITLSAASDTSILNVLPATITELRAGNDAQVLVLLNAGGTRLLARITQHSCRALALTQGQQVHAQIKGVALLD